MSYISVQEKEYNHVIASMTSERKENIAMKSRLLATLTNFASKLIFPARVNFTGSITTVKKITSSIKLLLDFSA